MNRLRRTATLLLICSALLFLFIGGAVLLDGYTIFAPQSPALAQLQAVPTAAAEKDDAWAQWVSVDIPTLANTYFIQRLDENKRALCTCIYQGISSFEEEITLPEPVEEQLLSEIMWLISYDCPELFQISGDYSYYVRENEPDMVLSIKPTYILTPEEYTVAMNKVRDTLSTWLNSSNARDEYEIEKLIYENLIQTCTYSEEGTHAGNVYGAIVLGSARCEGYAKAMCMALRTTGIESLILTGEARTSASNEETRIEKHAWNIAKINGSYCQLDSTWDDPDEALSFDTCYAYFNLTDEEMYRSRSVDDIYKKWNLPACTNSVYSYHTQAGAFIYEGQDSGEAIKALLTQADSNEKNYITGKFETEEQMQAFSEQLDTWISDWYYDMKFSKGSYHWVTYSDSRVFSIFNLYYE